MAGDIGVNVDTSSVVVLAANGSRQEAVICNNSTTQTVYLFFGSTAVVGAGIRLNPKGDYITTDTTLAIYAIASASGGRVTGSWV